MRIRPIVVWLGVLLAASAARAQSTGPQLARGTWDLSLEVSPDFSGPTGDTLRLDAGVGYFLRDRLAARLTAGYETIEDIAPGENDYRARELVVVGEAHFPKGRLVPYLGLGLGFRWLSYLDDSESAVVWGPRAGLELFLADNVAIDLSVSYRLAGSRVYVNDFEREDSDLELGIGLRAVLAP